MEATTSASLVSHVPNRLTPVSYTKRNLTANSPNDIFVSKRTSSGNYAVGFGSTGVTDWTIASNTAGQGGGVYTKITTVAIVGSTLSGNSAIQGGGTYSTVFQYSAASVTISSSAIFGNTATEGGGIYVSPLGTVFFNAKSQVTLTSSIVAGNSTDVFGPLVSTSQFSLIGDASNAGGLVHGANNNIVGNAGVGTIPLSSIVTPLGNYGGPTLTHALVPGSPALNAGSNPLMLTTDQRGTGYARVAGSQIDIGPYELQHTLKVTSIRINDGSVQRSRVTNLTINFDQPAAIPLNLASAIQLRRQSDSQLVTIQAAPNGPSLTLTFTGGPVEFGSLADGRYTLTIFAAEVPGLDGDGDGMVGGNYEIVGNTSNKLFRLFGDGTVSAADFNGFRLAYGSTGLSIFDFNGDNQVSAADFNQFRTRYGATLVP